VIDIVDCFLPEYELIKRENPQEPQEEEESKKNPLQTK
jgi:hypothetical protein